MPLAICCRISPSSSTSGRSLTDSDAFDNEAQRWNATSKRVAKRCDCRLIIRASGDGSPSSRGTMASRLQSLLKSSSSEISIHLATTVVQAARLPLQYRRRVEDYAAPCKAQRAGLL